MQPAGDGARVRVEDPRQIGLIELYAGATLPDGFKDTAPYIVLLIMLAVRPQGLFGTLTRKKV